MTMPLTIAGRNVAEKLAIAEDLANQTLAAYADLMGSMMDVRTKTDVAPYVGQIAVARINAASSKIVEAQGDTAKAHKQLRSDFCTLLGIPDDGSPCPTNPFVHGLREAA